MAISRQKAEAIIEVIGKSNIQDLAKQIEGGFSKAEKSAKKLDQSSGGMLDRMKGQWTELHSMLQVVGGALDMVRESVIAMGTSQAVAKTFDEMGLSLERLRKASADTVSDDSLRKFAIQAERAGLAAQDFEALTDVAARLSASGTGAARGIVTTADALEELLDTVVGASDSGLEKFGVIADMPELTKQFAAEMGVAGEFIDKSTQSAAMLDLILGDVAESVKGVTPDEGALARMQQFDVVWQNLKQDVGMPLFELAAKSVEDFLDALDSPEWRSITASVSKFLKALAWQVKNAASELRQFKELVMGDEVKLSGTAAQDMQIVIEKTREYEAAAKKAAAAQQALADAEDASARASERKSRRQRVAGDLNKKQVKQISDLVRQTQRQREKAYGLAAAMSEVAEAMGDSKLATDKFAEAIKAADLAGIDLTKRVGLLEGAARAMNSEFAQSLLTTAAMEDAAGNALKAEILRSQAQDILERKLAKPRTGGGGGRKEDPFAQWKKTVAEADKFIQKELDAIKARADARRQAREDAREFDRLFPADEVVGARLARAAGITPEQQAAWDAVVKKADAHKQQLQDQQDLYKLMGEASAELGRASLESLGAFMSGVDETGLKVVNVLGAMADQYQIVTGVIQQFEAAGLSASDAVKASLPSMLSASGQLVAGLVSDQRAKAAILAVMESAAAAASYASMDYVGGSLHAIAATTYGIVAATGMGAGSAVAGARTAARQQRGALPSVAGHQQQAGGSAYNITIRMDGATIVGSDRRRVSRDFMQILSDAAQQSPQFSPA